MIEVKRKFRLDIIVDDKLKASIRNLLDIDIDKLIFYDEHGEVDKLRVEYIIKVEYYKED